jgi:hypothetical protein
MEAGDQVFDCAMGPWNNGNHLVGRFLWRDRAWVTVALRRRSSTRRRAAPRRHGIATNRARASEGVRGCVGQHRNFCREAFCQLVRRYRRATMAARVQLGIHGNSSG